MATFKEPGLISVVIVAADSGPILLESIDAVLSTPDPVEVILVDNASKDGQTERARTIHSGDPRLRVLHLDRNIGFGPACNRGAAVARGRALVFLNPDCIVRRDTIQELSRLSGIFPRIGVLGVEVVGPDGRPARGNRRRDPTLRRSIMELSGLARMSASRPFFAGVEVARDAQAALDVEPVDAVSGACIFLPRNVFEEIHGFDEAYFLHVEDLDLCRRVREAGYEVAIVSRLRVRHELGTSSRHRPLFVAWHKHRGMWRYFTRYDPAARHFVVRWLVRSALWVHFVCAAPRLLIRYGRSASRDAANSVS